MIRLFLKTIHTKREGIFEIDLNLRPYGKKGNLAVSLNNFKKYFSDSGEAYFFERQALTKLRFITSNKTGDYIKKEALMNRDSFVYSKTPVDLKSLYKIRNMQLKNYIKENKINIKYSSGGVVDIEYIVQTLQICYGYKLQSVRQYSTLDGLEALFKGNIIDNEMYKNLKDSYIFYRNLINILRIVKGNARDLTIYQEESIEFDFLVKRSHFIGIIEENSKELLNNKINKYMSMVKEYFEKLPHFLYREAPRVTGRNAKPFPMVTP